MHNQLKKEIVNFMIDNSKEFQLVNRTTNEFRQYIYTPKGDYCIGGEEVSEFINKFDEIL